jgi:two-component system, chemotaxis family, chemotaxis protein CheY
MAMKILVVDDERDVQLLFEQRFRKEIRDRVMEFIFAYSGNEALSFLNMHRHEAVLILSDINMPGMSGLELLKHIKQKFEFPPPVVMMITAYGDAENYNKAITYGADDFLIKPLDFNLLKEKLNNRADGKDISGG